jgi:hypothetical protein
VAVTNKFHGNTLHEQRDVEKFTKIFQIMAQSGYLTLATTFIPVDAEPMQVEAAPLPREKKKKSKLLDNYFCNYF